MMCAKAIENGRVILFFSSLSMHCDYLTSYVLVLYHYCNSSIILYYIIITLLYIFIYYIYSIYIIYMYIYYCHRQITFIILFLVLTITSGN